MPRKYSVDEVIDRMLKHADKYPELRTYAKGLREMAKAESKSKRLTSSKKKDTIQESKPIIPATRDEALAVMGV